MTINSYVSHACHSRSRINLYRSRTRPIPSCRAQASCLRSGSPIHTKSFVRAYRWGPVSLSVRCVSRILLALPRTMPRRSYTLISPPPSCGRGKARASKDSTVAWVQTWSVSSLGHVSHLSCMRTWHGCFGRPLSGGKRDGKELDYHSAHTRYAGRKIIICSASRSKGIESSFIDKDYSTSRYMLAYSPTHSFIYRVLDEYISNSGSRDAAGQGHWSK